MKLLLENWRKFVNEKKWEDYDIPKNQWSDISATDIKSSQDPTNVDLSDQLFDLISTAYAGIGGHFDFNNPGDLPADHDDWIAIDWDEDPEPDEVLQVPEAGQPPAVVKTQERDPAQRAAQDAAEHEVRHQQREGPSCGQGQLAKSTTFLLKVVM